MKGEKPAWRDVLEVAAAVAAILTCLTQLIQLL